MTVGLRSCVSWTVGVLCTAIIDEGSRRLLKRLKFVNPWLVCTNLNHLIKIFLKNLQNYLGLSYLWWRGKQAPCTASLEAPMSSRHLPQKENCDKLPTPSFVVPRIVGDSLYYGFSKTIIYTAERICYHVIGTAKNVDLPIYPRPGWQQTSRAH